MGLYRLKSGEEYYATSRRHAWLTHSNTGHALPARDFRNPRGYWVENINGIQLVNVVPLDPPVPYKVARKLCQDLNEAKGI